MRGSNNETLNQKRPWTSQLFKAEQNILLSSRKLERAFREINDESSGDTTRNDLSVPNPMKLIHRLTALEISIGQLRQDCESMSRHRNQVVQSVVSDQNKNILQIKEMDSFSEYLGKDYEWDELSQELRTQLGLFSSTATEY